MQSDEIMRRVAEDHAVAKGNYDREVNGPTNLVMQAYWQGREHGLRALLKWLKGGNDAK